MTCCLSSFVENSPSLAAHARLIIGVSSWQSSMNFFLSRSFCAFDLGYAATNRPHEETRPVKNSAYASLITSGQKTFCISASLRCSEILQRDRIDCSRTTVSSDFPNFSSSGKNTVLSVINSLPVIILVLINGAHLPYVAKFFSDSKQNFVILRSCETCTHLTMFNITLLFLLTIKERNKAITSFSWSNRKNDRLQSVNRVDFQVDLFSRQFLFQEIKCVNRINHCRWVSMSEGIIKRLDTLKEWERPG